KDHTERLKIARPTPQTGNRLDDKICCPFHKDNTPSLQIYADGHYHCFGCGAHGNVSDLPDAPDPPRAERHAAENGLRRAHELWEEARSIEGTLAERYLVETRHLDLAGIAGLDDVLRFHPSCPFGPGGIRHPCLIA